MENNLRSFSANAQRVVSKYYADSDNPKVKRLAEMNDLIKKAKDAVTKAGANSMSDPKYKEKLNKAKMKLEHLELEKTYLDKYVAILRKYDN